MGQRLTRMRNKYKNPKKAGRESYRRSKNYARYKYKKLR